MQTLHSAHDTTWIIIIFPKPEIVFQSRLSYYSKTTLGMFYQALTHPTYIRDFCFVSHPSYPSLYGFS